MEAAFPPCSLHVFLPDHEGKPAVGELQVALVVAKVVDVSSLGFVDSGKIAELEAFFQHLIPVNFGFSTRIEGGENPTVFSEDIVDVADKIIGIAIEAVVEGGPAVVRAKLFIGAALEGSSTFLALLFHGRNLSVCKWLQTFTNETTHLFSD